jgi:hypothetical protein
MTPSREFADLELPRPAVPFDELAHAHRCLHCGTERYCEVMCCRDKPSRACWPCRQRGLE